MTTTEREHMTDMAKWIREHRQEDIPTEKVREHMTDMKKWIREHRQDDCEPVATVGIFSIIVIFCMLFFALL